MNLTSEAFVTRAWRTVLALLTLAIVVVGPAHAQSTHIQPKLVAESAAPAPGSSTTLALTMAPEPTWHGYWANGGDAGFGLSVEWNAPEGVTIAPFRYPVPDALILFGMMNHVYEHPYALLAEVQVDKRVAPGTDLTLSGVANWLACTDKVCVPEKAVISVALKAGDGKIAPAERTRFDGWRALLPQPLDRHGTWEKRGDIVRFAIPLPASTAIDAPHLFVETQDVVDYAAPQRFSRNGDHIVVETRFKGEKAGPVSALLKLGGGRGLSLTLDPGAVPAAGETIAGKAGGIDMGLFWTALGGAILGGLILNLMPCVFPILSLKALSLARSGGDARSAKIEALAYTAGAIVTALLLGGVLLALRAAGEQVGWAFQLQHPVSVLALLILALAITLNLLGAYELPSFGRGQALVDKGGAAGGFWTGALAAFVATPCSGPLLGAALGATLVLPAWAALPIFGGLGLGLALPFLAIGFVPALRNRLPKPGPWMDRFRKWMALPMGLTTLALAWLLWRQLGGGEQLIWPILAVAMALVLLTHYGSIQRGDRRSWLLYASGLLLLVSLAGTVTEVAEAERTADGAGSTFSADALAKARATGKPVFVYFTADWCLSCKANEAGAINREAVQEAFDKAGVVTLVGDWTNGDPVITRTLAEHGRNSVPLYLWYAPGAAKPEILPQILTPGLLTDKVGG
ncbi:thiol:disulfide interchange protein [Sphingopyxis sp. H038]|uniref:protein-disulfide reductase DsbD family protein n=1 Tax=unclassified Sphingopyxis TaxID=2614943 RepID=UPI000730EBAE|nr:MULTISPECIES: thioredoxin family protein [unclassified Sphingopyxis]KTE01442.1 thiol:disulfide interchange protein [Sphingopyxis sp. H012]KTE05341.1 thiol:disulfide interchange protein [Sphingopyxis sp. H093]KTE12817.1 thiol:disulfide interchange protein [Sphingopyxis sp. H053]KTE24325.1 thiol:disulfide interchange protein [Sphingopyxis sp. H080]KTE34825.1 thiol:disulfide interchange protein [Sphingopyxis sp. H038]